MLCADYKLDHAQQTIAQLDVLQPACTKMTYPIRESIPGAIFEFHVPSAMRNSNTTTPFAPAFSWHALRLAPCPSSTPSHGPHRYDYAVPGYATHRDNGRRLLNPARPPFMLEVQRRLYMGLWNLVCSAGFMPCGVLWYASLASTKANYQTVLSMFWGWWAFPIGSVGRGGEGRAGRGEGVSRE
ncbi:hypothetical protein A0H81_01736 [Grifola frondosa]|uniref:Uncharacterized protein n=1 Tax=Grifola frondosa TaxID=5627 RepID=A0A1C7MNW1_GRIFR|nr:hypothetical protein A0H81_01736 [Grifola frondosa]